MVSPFAFRSMVDHQFSSHVSTLAFIETLFRLRCMKLDCKANNLLEAFNSGHKNLSRFIDSFVWTDSVVAVTIHPAVVSHRMPMTSSGPSLTPTASP